jgi:hypothetical protein
VAGLVFGAEAAQGRVVAFLLLVGLLGRKKGWPF